ncbi:MAG: transcription elongation factor GreA [Armatimonadetes bacterium]|nr:transcription elongation factor GreA [Armatimonadota bacterium]
MSNPVMLTPEGYHRLKEELDDLKSRARREIAEAIREAKSHGDLRENAAYHEAKLNKDRLEQRIGELEKMLLVAKIVERPEASEHVAHLGSVVTLEDMEWGDKLQVTLVGSYEADPAKNLISITSPLGSAILGKEVGDEADVETPAGTQRYRVESID